MLRTCVNTANILTTSVCGPPTTALSLHPSFYPYIYVSFCKFFLLDFHQVFFIYLFTFCVCATLFFRSPPLLLVTFWHFRSNVLICPLLFLLAFFGSHISSPPPLPPSLHPPPTHIHRPFRRVSSFACLQIALFFMTCCCCSC